MRLRFEPRGYFHWRAEKDRDEVTHRHFCGHPCDPPRKQDVNHRSVNQRCQNSPVNAPIVALESRRGMPDCARDVLGIYAEDQVQAVIIIGAARKTVGMELLSQRARPLVSDSVHRGRVHDRGRGQSSRLPGLPERGALRVDALPNPPATFLVGQ